MNNKNWLHITARHFEILRVFKVFETPDKVKSKNIIFEKHVQISKYRLLWFQILISCCILSWLPAPSSVENTVSNYLPRKNFITFCHTHKIAKMFNLLQNILDFSTIHHVQAESQTTKNFFLTCMLLIFLLNAYIYTYIICTYIYISHVFYVFVLLEAKKFKMAMKNSVLATLLLTISIRFSKEEFFASVAKLQYI